VLIAHLSDLHLRNAGDATWLDHQLDRIAAAKPDHLAITGDLLDRWAPALLERALDSLAARGLLEARRTTILHGNHDLASSGGHPRGRADLWRLGLRFWDPPPLIRRRARRFQALVEARAPGVAQPAPFGKALPGLRIAVLDTIPVSWVPFTVERGAIVLRHAVGALPAAQTAWLGSQPHAVTPLVVLMHHLPLGDPSFEWTPSIRATPMPRVVVPMHVMAGDRDAFWRAADSAGVRLVLCGHVHRASLSWHGRIAVGLNGQSGAAWAGRSIAWYEITSADVTMDVEPLGNG
jgi:3',5'-cyclic AMP phosphodiesterase CpdA